MRSSTRWRDFQLFVGLEIDAFELFSFDIFDTVLLRAVRSPPDVFLFVADRAHEQNLLDRGISRLQFMGARRQLEIDARERMRANAGTSEVTLNEIWANAPSFLGPPAEMSELEWEVEAQLAFSNPYALDLMRELNERGKRVCLTSDTYFEPAQLSKLLSYIGISESLYDRLFASCERLGSKHDGSMYGRVLRHYSTPPDKTVHFGDNQLSDWQQARNAGLDSRYFAAIHTPAAQTERETLLGWKSKQDPLHKIQGLGRGRVYDGDEAEQFFYSFGAATLGPSVSAYCAWIAQDAIRRNIDAIFPVLREGFTFGRLIRRALDYLGSTIRVEEINLSRRSCFLPSIENLDKEAIGLFCQRRNYTLMDFIVELGTSRPKSLAHILNEQLSSISNPNHPHSADFFRWAQSRDVQNAAKEAGVTARRMLVDYCQTRFDKCDQVALVDFGAAGNPQTWLASCLGAEGSNGRRPEIFNYLMYAIPAHVKNLVKGTMILPFCGYQSEHEVGQTRVLHRSFEPYETLMDGLERTTVGYQRDQNGNVHPVLGNRFDEPTHNKWILATQQGIDDAWEHFQHAAEKVGLEHLLSEDARERCLTLLTGVLDAPTQAEANFLGELVYEFNDGSNAAERVCGNSGKDLLLHLGPERFLADYKRRWGYWGSRVCWPQGSLTQSHPEAISDALGKVYTDYDFHFLTRDIVKSACEWIKVNGPESVGMYGAGVVGMEMLKYAERFGLHVEWVIDSNPALHSRPFGDRIITSVSSARNEGCSIFLVASAAFTDEITDIINGEFKNEKPIIFSSKNRDPVT